MMILAAARQVAICASAAIAMSLAIMTTPVCAQDYAAIVAQPDRTDADRQTDKRRDPVNLLTFTGAKTGWTVLDMGAGAGYSTELMARSVGPTGKVYGQNDADSEKLRARMTTPVMRNVVALVRPSDDPVPADLHDLDLITFYFAYHDTTYMQVDRAKMDKAMFAALKPGGILVIADHSARPEDGATVGKTYHRIAETDVARGGRGGGIRVRRRRRFPASSRRHSHGNRLPQPYAGGRVRAEVPKADVSRPLGRLAPVLARASNGTGKRWCASVGSMAAPVIARTNNAAPARPSSRRG